jgi:dTDP-glucose 4,6-dehydratase
MKILVTGGSGFIGSHFIEEVLKTNEFTKLYNLDADTYAANKNLSFDKDIRYQKLAIDISQSDLNQKKYFETLDLDYVVHFAAESHVDSSIEGPRKFINTNIVGTFNLLESFKCSNIKKFIHISTDEVFGSLNNKENSFDTDSPYRPNNPYAASKAASDLLVRSYIKTYGFPAIITNCSNNFGPRQFTEKLIPVCITKLKCKEKIPLYGNGSNTRDWIYVKDHVKTIVRIIQDGVVGHQYLIGGDNEISNYELIHLIKESYEELTQTTVDWEWFKYIEDRKGHDLRYAINNWELKQQFPDFVLSDFKQSLKTTIQSYL